jgi:hypothetical protein
MTHSQKIAAFLAAAALYACVALPAAALPTLPFADMDVSEATPAQYPRSLKFRRCMRARYGPRYFARVPRAYRYHMAQACMA